jgi:hypothetical protein
MGWLDKLTGKQPAPEEPAASAPSVRDGIHHEYFVDDEPADGRFGWLCRVYDKAGNPSQMTGAEESREQAASAAQTWAASAKRKLRGEA